jgi:hypothetical protein
MSYFLEYVEGSRIEGADMLFHGLTDALPWCWSLPVADMLREMIDVRVPKRSEGSAPNALGDRPLAALGMTTGASVRTERTVRETSRYLRHYTFSAFTAAAIVCRSAWLSAG